MKVFKGYAKGEGKQPAQKMNDSDLVSFEVASKCDSYGGKLIKGFIDISFDTDELSQKFWDMAEENKWKCKILENPSNGHIHSFWKLPDDWC